MRRSRVTLLFSASTPIAIMLVLILSLVHEFNVLLLCISIGVGFYLFRYQTVVFIVGLFVVGLYFAHYHYRFDRLKGMPPKPVERCEIISIPDAHRSEEEVTVSFTCRVNRVNYFVRFKGQDSFPLQIGDIIEVEGTHSMAKPNTVPYLFNYQQYLLSKNIWYIIQAERINPIRTTRKPHFRMINRMIERYDGPLSRYQLSLLIGHKNAFSDQFQDDIQFLNISHLFVVSGFHVTTLALMIRYVLRLLHVTKESTNRIINVVLFGYLAINNFQPSIMRAVLLYYGVQFKNYFRLPISSANLLTFIFLLNVLYSPFIIFHVGFQLSYLITFILILSKDLLEKYQHRFLINHFLITLLAQSFSLPIVANFTFQYNGLALFLAPILLIYFNFIVFPLTILSMIFEPLTPLIKPLFDAYERLIHYFSSWNQLTFTIGGFNPTRRTLYYSTLYTFIRRKELKKSIMTCGICLIFIIFFYHRLSLSTIVAYIDVGQGDATFIQTPFQSCTLLIDTGGTIFPTSTFHPGERHVLPYLQAHGLKKLDYLIVSHGDQDHIGDYRYIVDAIDVQTILFSAYDESELKQEMITYAKEKGINVKELKQGDALSCGPITLKIHSPKIPTLSSNESSLVFTIQIKKDRFLFTGDISSQIEERIAAQLPSDITFLKVSHHGSKSSTSDRLLQAIQPEYAIISVGQNEYGHPSEEVLERLKRRKCKVFTTRDQGTIVIKYFLNKRYIIPTLS